MENREVDELFGLLLPLLHALEALEFVARHLHPPDLPALLQAVDDADRQLRAQQARLADAPMKSASAASAPVWAALDAATDAVLSAFDGLRNAAGTGSATGGATGSSTRAAGQRAKIGADIGADIGAAYRALRRVSRAQQALYPLAALIPPVSQYFVEPDRREDAELLARLDAAGRPPDTGVMHVLNEPGTRGGHSLYVPEYYDAQRAWPLVVALHGGAGHGQSFLWSWLRAARSHGAILLAPTSVEPTWPLADSDAASARLAQLVAQIGARWRLDADRLLLTGMSDGGTFTFVSGLEPGSPFTHLAPIATGFQPMFAQMCDETRVRALPIFLVHGALDWMFPARTARAVAQAFGQAGAALSYREPADLSHTYPADLNTPILQWLRATPPAPRGR